MRISSQTWIAGFSICLPLLVQCMSNDRFEFPHASIVVGTVDLIRKGVHYPLSKDEYLRTGDTVIVEENSKLKLELNDGASWYLGKGSKLIIERPVPIADNRRRISVVLKSGQLHIVKRNDTGSEYCITTIPWIIRVTAADVTINAGNDTQTCSVSLFNGFAAFAPPGGNETILPACCRLVKTMSGGPGELQPINVVEIAALKSWVGSSIVDNALALSGCSVSENVPETTTTRNTTPPEWKRLPDETAQLGMLVNDTVEAVDPEQDSVTYELIKGFKGMQLDRERGILSYRGESIGKNTISIRAFDRQGNACTTSIIITITGGLTVRLSAPSMVQPSTPFAVTAVAGKQFAAMKLSYRFDLNGDGKYEIPGNGKVTKNATVENHVISEEGVYRLRVEARSEDGQSAWAGKTITVNAPPKAVLKVIPQNAQIGSPVVFDISESSDKRNGKIPLRVKYDIDGNGVWDVPGNGVASTSKTLTYYYKEPGTYTVIVQLTDMDGSTGTALADVVIGKGIGNGSIKAPDTVKNNDSVFQKAMASKKIVIVNNAAHVNAGGPYRTGVNKDLALWGTADDIDNSIIQYAWDADGDGVIDITSKTSAAMNYRFKHAGTYTAIFIITTDDGKKVTDSTTIEVENKSPKAFAGDDIVSHRNGKITLSGTGNDEDGVIVSYEWDFDGNGNFDWISKENGTVTHSFTNYTSAILRVKDSDGAAAYDTLRIIICPEGMRLIDDGKYCIDAYEFPNKYKAAPQTDVTYEEAQALCRHLGKRLCTSDEWITACSHERKNYLYPYGKKYDVGKCNTLGNPRLKNSLAVSGDFIDCKNDDDIYDMSGNAAEWTVGRDGSHFVYGGSWQNGEQESRCDSRVALLKNKKYFYVGFRCCK
jgi:hypothetical protein